MTSFAITEAVHKNIMKDLDERIAAQKAAASESYIKEQENQEIPGSEPER